LRDKLDALGYGFLIPIFFITVGADLNLPALLQSPGTLAMFPVLLGAAFVVKMVPAAVFLPFFGRRRVIAGGFLISARLSLIIAVAMIGRDLEVISEAMNAAAVLLAVATCTLAPLGFRWLVPHRTESRNRIVVMGCRHLADLLGRRLRERGKETVTVCPHPGRRWKTDPDEAVPVHRRDTVVRELAAAGAARARLVIALEERDADNLLICRTARLDFGVGHLISWVQDADNENAFHQLGVRIVNPPRATLFFIEAMALDPGLYDLAREMDASAVVRKVRLENSALAGRRIQDIDWPEGVKVMGIVRGGEQMVPDNQTRIRANDILTLVGGASQVDRAVRRMRRQDV
jgi:trk system potassium uptake protein